MADTLVTEIVIDSRAAEAGLRTFQAMLGETQSASQRLTTQVDTLGLSFDRMAIAAKAASTAMEQSNRLGAGSMAAMTEAIVKQEQALARLHSRHNEIAQATERLRTGQASFANLGRDWPILGAAAAVRPAATYEEQAGQRAARAVGPIETTAGSTAAAVAPIVAAAINDVATPGKYPQQIGRITATALAAQAANPAAVHAVHQADATIERSAGPTFTPLPAAARPPSPALPAAAIDERPADARQFDQLLQRYNGDIQKAGAALLAMRAAAGGVGGGGGGPPPPGAPPGGGGPPSTPPQNPAEVEARTSRAAAVAEYEGRQFIAQRAQIEIDQRAARAAQDANERSAAESRNAMRAAAAEEEGRQFIQQRVDEEARANAGRAAAQAATTIQEQQRAAIEAAGAPFAARQQAAATAAHIQQQLPAPQGLLGRFFAPRQATAEQESLSSIAGGASDFATLGKTAGEAAREAEKVGKAVEEVGHRATGAGGRVREFLVILREIARGDFTRMFGSITIELQRFGALGYILNPIALSIIGVAGGLAAVLLRAREVESELRNFGVITNTFGTGTPQQFQGLVDQLRNSGSAYKDAIASAQAIARAPDVPRTIGAGLATLARDITATEGGDAGQMTEKLAQAFEHGEGAVEKLAIQFHALRPEQAALMRDMAEHGNSVGALTVAYSALLAKFGGNFERSLAPGEKAITALGDHWRSFLDAIGNTSAFKTLETELDRLLQKMSTAEGAKTTLGVGGGALAGAGIGTVVAGFPGGTALGAGIGAGVGYAAANPPQPPAWVGTVLDVARQGMEAIRLPAPAGQAGSADKQAAAADKTSGAAGQLSGAAGDLSKAATQLTPSVALTPGTAVSGVSPGVSGPAPGALKAITDALIQQESGGKPGIVSSAGAIGLMQIMPGTGMQVGGATPEQLKRPEINVPIGQAYLGRLIDEFGTLGAGLTAYNAGPEHYREYLKGQYQLKPESQVFAANVLAQPTARAAGLTGAETRQQLGLPNEVTGIGGPTAEFAIGEQQRLKILQQTNEAMRQSAGVQRESTLAGQQAQRQAAENNAGWAAETAAANAARMERERFNAEAAATHDQNQRDISDRKAGADAFRQYGEVVGGQVVAKLQAANDALHQGGDAATRFSDALSQAAVESLRAGEQQLASQESVVAGQERVARAALQSRDAEHRARIEAEAEAQAQPQVVAAQRTGVQANVDAALDYQRRLADQIRRREAVPETIGLAHDIQSQRDQATVLQLQLGLQGQNTHAIANQVELAKAYLSTIERYPEATADAKREYIASVASVMQLRDGLIDAEQHQQNLAQGFKQIAGEIESGITEQLRTALSRTPAEAALAMRHHWDDLRAHIRQSVADMIASIANATFIKPSLATGAQLLGLPEEAQQLGGGFLPRAPAAPNIDAFIQTIDGLRGGFGGVTGAMDRVAAAGDHAAASLGAIPAQNARLTQTGTLQTAAPATDSGGGTLQIVPHQPSVPIAGGFAVGTDKTPPGWILVGEKGPELYHQAGGGTVIPADKTRHILGKVPGYADGTDDAGPVSDMLASILDQARTGADLAAKAFTGRDTESDSALSRIYSAASAGFRAGFESVPPIAVAPEAGAIERGFATAYQAARQVGHGALIGAAAGTGAAAVEAGGTEQTGRTIARLVAAETPVLGTVSPVLGPKLTEGTLPAPISGFMADERGELRLDMFGRTLENLKLAIPPEQRRVGTYTPGVGTRPVETDDWLKLDPTALGTGLHIDEAGIRGAFQKALDDTAKRGGPDLAARIDQFVRDHPDFGPTGTNNPVEFWDTALRLPDRARFWYEISARRVQAETPASNDPSHLRRIFDVLAATSPQANPDANLKRAVGVLAERAQGLPANVDLIGHAIVRQALSEDGLQGLKTGSFSGTFQHIIGLADEAPLSVNDRQVAHMLGLDAETFTASRNDWLYEATSQYFQNLRDAENAARPGVVAGRESPLETWQLQALGWVHQRALQNVKKATVDQYDDYAVAMDRLKADLGGKGVDASGGIFSPSVLLDPRTQDLVSGTRARFMNTPTATVEVTTTRTAPGRQLDAALQAIMGLPQDTPGRARALAELEDMQRATMRSIATRPKGQQSIIESLMSSIVGKKVDVSRIDTEGFGTFEGVLSPNMRIPLTGRAGQKFVTLTEQQRQVLLSTLGEDLHQAAMGSSLFRTVPAAQARTYSLFVPETAGLSPSQLQAFGTAIGSPLNVSRTATGTLLDVVGGKKAPTYEQMKAAADRLFPDIETGILPRAYEGDYLKASAYARTIENYWKDRLSASTTADAGRRGSPRNPVGDFGDYERARERLRQVSIMRDQGSLDWLQEHASLIERAQAAAPAAEQPRAAAYGGGGAAGARSPEEAQRRAAEAAGGYAPLAGLPTKPIKIGEEYYVPGPFGPAQEAAEQYMRSTGQTYNRPTRYAAVDPERATRIAGAFEEMQHAPEDPAVRASYEALAKETLAQWQAIKATGLKVDWIQPGQADPYAKTPRLAAMDVIDNNHWWGYPTDLGFGTGPEAEAALRNNPMLQPTGETIGGREVLVNDVFRIVHDYFGHFKEGVGFRATGEENAWLSHSTMYSPQALPAMTAETRGQNSWVNFGPNAEFNKTASAAETVYAPQKIGRLPDWVVEEGRAAAQAEPQQPAAGGFFDVPAMQMGGLVASTGVALVHAGEEVVPASVSTAASPLEAAITSLRSSLDAIADAFRQGLQATVDNTGMLRVLVEHFDQQQTDKAAADPTAGLEKTPGGSPIANVDTISLGGSGHSFQISGINNNAAGSGLFAASNGANQLTGATINADISAGGAGSSAAIPSQIAASLNIGGNAALAGGPTTLTGTTSNGQSIVLNLAPSGTASTATTGAASLQAAAPLIGQGIASALQPSTGKPATVATGISGILGQLGPVSNLLSIASNGSSFFGGGSGGLFGGLSNFVNNLGSSLFGTATPLSASDIAAVSESGSSEGITGILQGSGLGGLGSTTLSSILSGAGAGFGAGSLLNSLLGGNQLGGTAGSAVGSIAGSILGSIAFPGIGTLLGGLFGGGGGGILGGLIGPGPSNQSAGANIGPGGQLSFNDVGASAANISGVNQVSSSIAQFEQALGQLTNAQGQPIGQIPAGALVVTQDNKQGIRVLSTMQGVGGTFGDNAQNAVEQTELGIIHNLTGVTGVLQKVLQNVTDPSQLQTAVQFADAYQRLQDAANSAFKSIQNGTVTLGPYQQALEQINSTFSGLISQAQTFGLPTSNIAAAQTAAQTQLGQDFQQSLDAALGSAEFGQSDFITALKNVNQTFVQNQSDLSYLQQNLPGFGVNQTVNVPGYGDTTVAAMQAAVTSAVQGVANATPSQMDAAQADLALRQGYLQTAENLAAQQPGSGIVNVPGYGNTTVAQMQAAVASAQQGVANATPAQMAAAQADLQLRQGYLATAQQLVAQQPNSQQNEIAGIALAQAGPILAGLSGTQLQTVISDFAQIAPEIANAAQSLLDSGKALPDNLTQITQGVLNPGLLTIEKAIATGFEQTQVGQATGMNAQEVQQAVTAEQQQALAQATGTQVPQGALPDAGSQLYEAVVNPLQLAIQKAQVLGDQQVAIAQASGQDIVKYQQAAAANVEQIWYNATQQLRSLSTDITSGTLSGLTAANQVPAAISYFNQILALVQGGNTNFLDQLASAGQAAVQAAQTAYGNGPVAEQVRQQVLSVIGPLLGPVPGTTGTQTQVPSIATTTPGSSTAATSSTSSTSTVPSSVATAAPVSATGTPTTSATQDNVGTGITAIAITYPNYPSAGALTQALTDANAGNPTGQELEIIAQAVQTGVLNPSLDPQFATVITEALKYVSGQTSSLLSGASSPLATALKDAQAGTASAEEWAVINQAVSAGVISPSSTPQYSTVIEAARNIANAQALSLNQAPNILANYLTDLYGVPRFAAGTEATPPGWVMVGEEGPEWMYSAAGGAKILPNGVYPPGMTNTAGPARSFAAGTAGWSLGTPPPASPGGALSNELLAELKAIKAAALANVKMTQAAAVQANKDARTGNSALNQINQKAGNGLVQPPQRQLG